METPALIRTHARTSGTLWAITAYFDPLGTGSRLHAYREFRRRLTVPLVAVELSYNGACDLEPGDAALLIRLEGGSVLWQKECLLNVALRALPEQCDAVAWCDCDIVFEREDWARVAREALSECALLQPFSRLWYLNKHELPEGARACDSR